MICWVGWTLIIKNNYFEVQSQLLFSNLYKINLSGALENNNRKTFQFFIYIYVNSKNVKKKRREKKWRKYLQTFHIDKIKVNLYVKGKQFCLNNLRLIFLFLFLFFSYFFAFFIFTHTHKKNVSVKINQVRNCCTKVCRIILV